MKKSNFTESQIMAAIKKPEGGIATKNFVKATVSNAKNEIKWMFAFWIGQIAVIAGTLMYFLGK